MTEQEWAVGLNPASDLAPDDPSSATTPQLTPDAIDNVIAELRQPHATPIGNPASAYGMNFENYAMNFENYAMNFENYAMNFENYAMSPDSTIATSEPRSNSLADTRSVLPDGSNIPSLEALVQKFSRRSV